VALSGQHAALPHLPLDLKGATAKFGRSL